MPPRNLALQDDLGGMLQDEGGFFFQRAAEQHDRSQDKDDKRIDNKQAQVLAFPPEQGRQGKIDQVPLFLDEQFHG